MTTPVPQWTPKLQKYLMATLRRAGYDQSEYLGEAYIAFRLYSPRWDPNRGPLNIYLAYRLRDRMQHVMRREAVVRVPSKDWKEGIRTSTTEHLPDDLYEDEAYI
jgi:hypothetical protein